MEEAGAAPSGDRGQCPPGREAARRNRRRGAVTLSEFLRAEIESGQFPGGSALVGTADRVLESASEGRAAILPEEAVLVPETLFDLASLTKPLATGALFALSGLDPERLSRKVSSRVEGDALRGRHSREACSPTRRGCRRGTRSTRGAKAQRPIAGRSPRSSSKRCPGSAVIYSDLNFLLLGDILELHYAARRSTPPLPSSSRSRPAPRPASCRRMPARPRRQRPATRPRER